MVPQPRRLSWIASTQSPAWLSGAKVVYAVAMSNGTTPSAPVLTSPTTIYSWEEYKLYFETTEKVIDRRISLNTWNYGICVALLVASGLLANWLVSKAELRLTILAAIGILSVMGMLLSRLWYRQVKDLKLLNNAKFEVLEAMAPHVNFPDSRPSFETFKKEWAILGRQGATAKKWGLKVDVLKSSSAEFALPWSFGAVFLVIIVLSVAIGWFNWDQLKAGIFKLPVAEKYDQLKKTTSAC
jgi:hypothetical protein